MSSRQHWETVYGSKAPDAVSWFQARAERSLRLIQETGVPTSAAILDVSNACLGLLNGLLVLANMIELGQVRAGIVVGTEDGRDLVEGTIDSLLKNPNLTRQSIKLDFASLTIGSGSAAIVLCHRDLSRTGE